MNGNVRTGATGAAISICNRYCIGTGTHRQFYLATGAIVPEIATQVKSGIQHHKTAALGVRSTQRRCWCRINYYRPACAGGATVKISTGNGIGIGCIYRNCWSSGTCVPDVSVGTTGSEIYTLIRTKRGRTGRSYGNVRSNTGYIKRITSAAGMTALGFAYYYYYC